MNDVRLKDDIFWVGVNDRTTDLFEGLWPIDGVGISYNSYVIKDQKNVLVDLSRGFKTDEFFDQISRIIDLSQLDYVIVNHMEPDHTGVLRTLRMINDRFEIICTQKAVKMLQDYYGINHNVRVINEGEVIDTGNHQLQPMSLLFIG